MVNYAFGKIEMAQGISETQTVMVNSKTAHIVTEWDQLLADTAKYLNMNR